MITGTSTRSKINHIARAENEEKAAKLSIKWQ